MQHRFWENMTPITCFSQRNVFAPKGVPDGSPLFPSQLFPVWFVVNLIKLR